MVTLQVSQQASFLCCKDRYTAWKVDNTMRLTFIPN